MSIFSPTMQPCRTCSGLSCSSIIDCKLHFVNITMQTILGTTWIFYSNVFLTFPKPLFHVTFCITPKRGHHHACSRAMIFESVEYISTWSLINSEWSTCKRPKSSDLHLSNNGCSSRASPSFRPCRIPLSSHVGWKIFWQISLKGIKINSVISYSISGIFELGIITIRIIFWQ